MIEGCAVSIGSTGPLDAGVAAGVVGQLAVLDVGTVVVLDALQDRRTNTCTTKQFTSRAFHFNNKKINFDIRIKRQQVLPGAIGAQRTDLYNELTTYVITHRRTYKVIYL